MAPSSPKERLSAWLDGELDRREAARLEAELRADPALRAELDALREAVSLLRAHGRVRAPAGFHDRLLAAVAEEAPPQPWWARLRRPFGVPIEGVAVLAAAAAVLAVAIPDPPAPATDPDARVAPAVVAPVQRDTPVGGEAAREAEAPRGSSAPLAPESPRPTASSEPPPSAAKPRDRAPAVPESVAPIEAEEHEPQAPPGVDDAQPFGRTVGYRYELEAHDPAVLGALQRIASRYQGAVHDLAGAPVAGTRQRADEATYAVRIPARDLQRFHRELERVGVRVVRSGDNRIFADELVDVAVTVRLVGGAAPGASE